MIWLTLCLIIILIDGKQNYDTFKNVTIYHLIDNELWGEADESVLQGYFPCFDYSLKCQLISSVESRLVPQFQSKLLHQWCKGSWLENSEEIIIGLFNIHSWRVLSKWPHKPPLSLFPTTFTIAESEESFGRFEYLFRSSFPHFDGNSTTSPFSSVQRTYFSGWNESMLIPLKPFTSLIKGASFVASTCHRGGGTTKRINVVMEMEKLLRVDSLGKCHPSPVGPEGITLKSGKTAAETLRYKQMGISHYMFHLAFENTYERGYVTEKVFDALIAGTVPVYLGSTIDCRPLLPHPKAAIFMDDFNNNVTRVVQYLKYLMKNESAYEMHRAWRKDFNKIKQFQHPMIAKSWPCRICEWAHLLGQNSPKLISTRNAQAIHRVLKLVNTHQNLTSCPLNS